MRLSKIEVKRARPALGTIFMLRLQSTGDESALESTLVEAFQLLEELEQKFSKFRESSDVCRLNQASVGREIPVSRELARLMALATSIWRESLGAFDPFQLPEVMTHDPITVDGAYARKNLPLTLDLTGLAKGFVVDEIVQFILHRHPHLSGVVNAGGDLRFFNTAERTVQIRVPYRPGQTRALALTQNSLATTSLEQEAGSSSVYARPPRAGLTDQHSVSVIANTCAVADALTKVGWFASKPVALACANKFGAQYFVFGPDDR